MATMKSKGPVQMKKSGTMMSKKTVKAAPKPGAVHAKAKKPTTPKGMGKAGKQKF